MGLDLLDHLSKSEVEDPLLDVLNRLREKSNNGKNIVNLSKSERVIYLIGELESEVNSGGFSSFHFNSSGIYAKETLDALKTVGSKYVYKLYKKSIKIYKMGPTNDGRFGKNEKDELSERQDNKLNKLDSKFYEYKEDIYQLQIDFIKRNIKEFDI